MGFLSGVLSNIKEHLGQHKNEIDIAIKSLETNKHAGKKGFNEAIAEVVAGVRGYNALVAGSNKKVSDKLNSFTDELTLLKEASDKVLREQDDAGRKINYKDQQVEDATKQIDGKVQEFQRTAEQFTNDIDTTVANTELKKSIVELNDRLRDNLKNVSVRIKHESARLETVRTQEAKEFEVAKQSSSAVLASLKFNADCRVDAQMKELIKNIKQRVTAIMKQLTKINSELLQHIDTLQDWIAKADNVIKESLKKVDEILKEVKWDDPNKFPKKIEEATEYIKIYAGGLHNAGKTVTDDIGGWVRTAKEWVTRLENGLKEDLNGVKMAINSKVTAVQNEIGKLHYVIERGGEGIGKKTIAEVIKHIQKKIAQITGRSGLQGVVDGVKQYAKAFYTDQTFEGMVREWIKVIVSKEPVSTYIDRYVDDNSGKFKDLGLHYLGSIGITPVLKNAIAEQILTNLKTDVITTAVEGVKSRFGQVVRDGTTTAAIQEYIDVMKTSCNSFADALGGQIKHMKVHVHKIVKAIGNDNKLFKDGNTGEHSKTYLESAVSAVFQQLVATAIEAGEAIQTFAGDSGSGLQRHIDESLATANAFDQKLRKALAIDELQRPDSSGKTYAANVDTAINQVTTTLEQQLPQDDYGVVSLSGFVSFKEGGRRGNGKSRRQQLDDAIAKIESDVTVNLSSIDTFNDQVAQKITELTDKLNKLCNEIIKLAGPGSYRDGLQSKLTELRDTYFKDYSNGVRDADRSINKIKQDLSDLQNALKTVPVDLTNKLFQYVSGAENHFAKLIKDQIHQDIKTAETALTTHARRRYVDSIKWLLEQFVEKVKQEFAQLLPQIEHDKHIGLKGFMEAVEGEKGDNVNGLLSNSDIPTLCRSVETFFAPVKKYIDSEINRLEEKELKKHPSLPRSQDPYTAKLTKLYAALSGLISHVYTSNKYDRDLPTKLDDLTAAVAELTTDGFPNPVTAMLHGVSGGCQELVGALGKVYISRYGGANVRWKHDEKAVNNCAKAFLTIVPSYFHGLHQLFYKGATEWKEYTVAGNAKSDRKAGELKTYLQGEGYDIDQLKDQTGKDVAFRLSRGFARYQSFNTDPEELKTYKNYIDHFKKHEGLLSRLFYYLDAYNHVGHLVAHPRPRHPSSVFDILLWLNGLPYNPVYHALSYDGFSGLFEKEQKKGDAPADDDGPTFEGEEADTLPAYPKDITAASLADKLTEVTTYAEDVLLSILGYGHNEGIYACDFYTNAGKLAYPSSAAKCLDVLVELLYRLFHQLRFLYEQCSNSTQFSGWAECYYGQGVGGSSWKCNTKQCADQKCKQIADQNGKQKCELHPKCGVKSPLQSFLEDGLPGFLPHPYSKADCKLSCSAPNHFGKPCKTPMGFADISITASHTSKGCRLYKVLKEFCGTSSAPLTVLCSSLLCVLGRPPQTLGDMFAFYHLFVTTWNDGGKKHKKEAFDEAVTKANLQRPYDKLNVASIFSTTHSGKSKAHTSGDVVSLVCSSRAAATCGQYLSPLSNDISATFSFKHADKYVSWIVYLTETFYSLLQKMYDECNSKCGGDTPKCRVAECSRKCTANGKSATSTHHPLCDSIINCPSTSSVLCTYGFTLVDRKKLSGTDDVDYKRTCNDLCNALKKVLDGESVLTQLFHSIDKFIFTIRAPFIWLNVALWLLSLLYLLHIMVIRLDLLHIKSHLRSPSSHRIAAQSLLAAGRVNKLNRVFYLQP